MFPAILAPYRTTLRWKFCFSSACVYKYRTPYNISLLYQPTGVSPGLFIGMAALASALGGKELKKIQVPSVKMAPEVCYKSSYCTMGFSVFEISPSLF
jgi:hypothetical protein